MKEARPDMRVTPRDGTDRAQRPHDSQAVDQLLTRGSTESGVWADAAYRSAEIAQANNMGGTLVRTIGLVRAKARIGMKNLACSKRRPRPIDFARF